MKDINLTFVILLLSLCAKNYLHKKKKQTNFFIKKRIMYNSKHNIFLHSGGVLYNIVAVTTIVYKQLLYKTRS